MTKPKKYGVKRADYDYDEPFISADNNPIYKCLFDRRIIMMTSEINSITANMWKSQLLYLHHLDPNEEIEIYIDSPGGCVYSGMSIIDIMNWVSNPIKTVNIRCCCSMGALILSSGEKNRRYSLPSARTMIHQPLGGVGGQASDIEIEAKEILILKKELNQILSKNTGQKLEKITIDTDRDYWMRSEEALKYGMIDHIL